MWTRYSACSVNTFYTYLETLCSHSSRDTFKFTFASSVWAQAKCLLNVDLLTNVLSNSCFRTQGRFSYVLKNIVKRVQIKSGHVRSFTIFKVRKVRRCKHILHIVRCQACKTEPTFRGHDTQSISKEVKFTVSVEVKLGSCDQIEWKFPRARIINAE